MNHLTEDERQSLADGSLSGDLIPAAEAHLQTCDQCAADVLRLSRLVTRAREAAMPSELSGPDMWPAIRDRIEQAKVANIGAVGSVKAEAGRRSGKLWWIIGSAAALAAAAIIIMTTRDNSNAITPEQIFASEGISLVAAADSARAYEDEAQVLLDNLELAKARLHPDVIASFNHDLRSVDSAIVETKAAIAKDPSNRALRQLLASSYRQKVDLLKRLSNAG